MAEPYYNVSQIELEEVEKEDLESDDAVGFSSSKPIFFDDLDNFKDYFKKLKTEEGEDIFWHRRSSINTKTNGWVDICDGVLSSGEYYTTMYVKIKSNEPTENKVYINRSQKKDKSVVNHNYSFHLDANKILLIFLITAIIILIIFNIYQYFYFKKEIEDLEKEIEIVNNYVQTYYQHFKNEINLIKYSH